jgi:formamidopyrimidine-DNA glycosylase
MAFFATSGESPESADRPSAVHHRIGFPCQDCDDEVRSVEYRRYTVAYCPTCQTGGKEIADNTTSKFLK